MGYSKNNNKIPMYKKISTDIKNLINQNVFDAGDVLPSEKELIDKYSVSRTTVRRALSELEYFGYIYKIQGSGSFVRNQQIDHSITYATSFTEDVENKNLKPGSVTLLCEIVKADKDSRAKMGLNLNDLILKLDRLRTVNDNIVGIHRTILNISLLDNNKFDYEILRQKDISLYKILKKNDINLSKAFESIGSSIIKDEDRILLGLSKNDTTLNIKRISYSHLDEIIEITEMVYNARHYRLSIWTEFI